MASYIPYHALSLFPSLVMDYLDEKEDLLDYVSGFDRDEHLLKVVRRKAENYTHRDALGKVMEQQYADMEKSDAVRRNLDRLKQENCFTVTTGHQICFLTGPLFFPIKIVQAINETERLNREFPDHHFVPVFWMATEDHDYEEIRTSHIFNHDYTLDAAEEGMLVGRVPVEVMNTVLPVVEETLVKTEGGQYAWTVIEDAWKRSATLADFTRHLVNALFGQWGVIVLEPDQAELKALMAPQLEQDLKENTSYLRAVEQSEALGQIYPTQVAPRETNWFYVRDNKRYRLDRKPNGILATIGNEWVESESWWIDEARAHPENFSPNVILRPLYQEIILPNVAYIGGGAEVQYWMQFKGVFEGFDIPFPIVKLRQSLLVSEPADCKKLEKLRLSVQDLFQDDHEITDQIIRQEEEQNVLKHQAVLRSLEDFKDELLFLVRKVDKSLEGSIRAHHKQEVNYVKELVKDLRKRLKEKRETEIGQALKLKEKWMPGGKLHERRDNLMQYLAKYGPGFLNQLKSELYQGNDRLTILKPHRE